MPFRVELVGGALDGDRHIFPEPMNVIKFPIYRSALARYGGTAFDPFAPPRTTAYRYECYERCGDLYFMRFVEEE